MITRLPTKRISAISQWKTFIRVLPTRWRRKPAGVEITSSSFVTLCIGGNDSHNLTGRNRSVSIFSSQKAVHFWWRSCQPMYLWLRCARFVRGRVGFGKSVLYWGRFDPTTPSLSAWSEPPGGAFNQTVDDTEAEERRIEEEGVTSEWETGREMSGVDRPSTRRMQWRIRQRQRNVRCVVTLLLTETEITAVFENDNWTKNNAIAGPDLAGGRGLGTSLIVGR